MSDTYLVRCPKCESLIEIDDDLSKLSQCFKCGWNEYDDEEDELAE
jgi:predicted nucleic-acid-binding Zn-ribbon protein